ncbi:hypothetical protein CGL51_12320 [Pyrobaculum aerophilum]|uniref:Uncharacterized protein n=1 Tax=Pyrobaculum aerophilum TaxID=13773 RepID=A0A371QUV2_9CREN|nr:hypothetical protein CGL51_12320 [Pyrobaculum aerophilum]
MFDKNTLNFLKNIEARCHNEAFYRNYKDICIATKIALSNIKGGGVKLRTPPSREVTTTVFTPLILTPRLFYIRSWPPPILTSRCL